MLVGEACTPGLSSHDTEKFPICSNIQNLSFYLRNTKPRDLKTSNLLAMDNLNALLQLWQTLLKGLGAPEWLVTDFSTLFSGFLLLAIALYYAVQAFNSLSIYFKQRRLNDLHPYFYLAEIGRAIRYYIPTYYQTTSPSQDDEPGRRYIASPRDKLISLFLKKAFGHSSKDNRFYLVLADSGMGKSTFMINLFLRYKRRWMPFRPKHQIKLVPLGHPHALEDLDKMDDREKENTILLLDAFDEDTEAIKDYQKRLGEIIQKVWRFREVVITCRTQFFPSRDEEPHETGHLKHLGDGGPVLFQKVYISVFNDRDILLYLLKRFNVFNPFQWCKIHRAWCITQKSPNLMVRPMLLSHINDLLNSGKDYEYTYQIYEVLIQKWVEREANKPGIAVKYGTIHAFKQKLYTFSRDLALNLFQHQEERGGLFIDNSQAIFTDSGLQLSNLDTDGEAIQDVTNRRTIKESDWRTHSLINRNAEGQYKFAHKSILEYFVALEFMNTPENFTLLPRAGRFPFYEGMDSALQISREILLEKYLKSCEGYCKLKSQKGAMALADIQFKNIEEISELYIKNAEKIQIIIFNIWPEGNLRKMFLGRSNAPTLYHYYILMLRELRDRLGLYDLRGLPDLLDRLDQIDRLDLRNFCNLPGLRDRLNLLDLYDLPDLCDLRYLRYLRYLRDRLDRLDLRDRLDLHHRFNPHDLRDLFKLLGQIDLLDQLDLTNLRYLRDQLDETQFEAIKTYLSECRALQESLPKVKIVY